MEVVRVMALYLKKGTSEVEEEKDTDVYNVVKGILADIEKNGEESIRKYSEKFDGWNPESFLISEDEIIQAKKSLPETFIQDTDYCQQQIKEFAKAQLESLSEVEIEIQPGVTLGHKLVPVANVGAYIPGGRYPIIASAHMSIIPPKVAGVERIIACTPPQQNKKIHPGVLYAIHAAGADQIYAIGGVQAIGAMAYGMGTKLKPVDFIVGPGNRFVAEAKRQIYGEVGIDQLAGPSEILIIADETADPILVAADLLGQCEHDPNAVSILITNSQDLAKKVMVEIDKQLPKLKTSKIAGESWKNYGEIILVNHINEAIKLANDYAIEHVEVHAKNLEYFLDKLKNYGSLFLGEETTVAYGDKGIGTNHILPTGRAARYTGGLWVGKFLKTLTYQKSTREASKRLGEIISRQCEVEGMHAHQITANLRVEKFRHD